MKNTKIEKIARKIAGGFDFVQNYDFGPDNMIAVAKKDVFAYQIKDDDLDKIRDLDSREGSYDTSYKVAGTWICTADVSESAGEFWLVKENQFKKNYETTPCDSKTMTKKVCGNYFTFQHYLATGQLFNCFRIPLDAPSAMTFKGQKFVPGDYVFIEDGECSEWARSTEFMQSQYEKIDDGDKPTDKIIHQYNEMISSVKQ